MSRPTTLFVLTDQLRASALRCYGDEQGSTPTIDCLAADLLRFENAYSPHAVCTPAHE
jgi:arylsulfatase A-like enzyme